MMGIASLHPSYALQRYCCAHPGYDYDAATGRRVGKGNDHKPSYSSRIHLYLRRLPTDNWASMPHPITSLRSIRLVRENFTAKAIGHSNTIW